jgi:taurine dioxygenase
MTSAVCTTSDIRVVPQAGMIGAEVWGLDLAQADDRMADQIRNLLHEHMVLFFPQQTLTLGEHVTFGAKFGPLEAHPTLKNPFTQHKNVLELAASAGGIADEWHTDLTCTPNPPVMSILRMVKCPPFGGDTMWTNLCAAYDELSKPMQHLCEGLTALHDAQAHGHPEQMAVHPVVRVHPITGRKALYVNEHFTRRIVEMSHEESNALLGLLTKWVHQERFTVRYRWTEGTIAIWDNRCTQHFVVSDFEGERIIQRVTVMGDTPEGTGAPGWARWKPTRRGAMTRHDMQLIDFAKRQQQASHLAE